MIQGANLAVLLLAKTAVSDDNFAYLLTNLAFAGIIGSIASMRLEVLVFQEHQQITYAAILMPVVALISIVAISFLVNTVVTIAGTSHLLLSPAAGPMMLGLGLSTILTFLFVQKNQTSSILAMRTAQTASLAVLMITILAKPAKLEGSTILLFIGISYAAPAITWLVYQLSQTQSKPISHGIIYLPKREMIKRSLMLTISTGLNSIYVNLPLLVASATQSTTFVSDFGLIMRMFTAPITLIFQVIGRLFLAEAIRWSINPVRATDALSKLIKQAVLQSVGLYLLVAPILFGILYIYREPLSLTHIEIAPFLFLAAIGQCAINPVSQVRIALGDERTFLIFDTLRLVLLAASLILLSRSIPYEFTFATTALTLYTSYIFFIRSRVTRYTGQ